MATNKPEEKSVKLPNPVSGRPESSFAMLARERKALRLADLLDRASITASEAESASADDWKLASEVAGVHPPSRATIAIVIQMLRSRETPPT